MFLKQSAFSKHACFESCKNCTQCVSGCANDMLFNVEQTLYRHCHKISQWCQATETAFRKKEQVS